MDSINSEIVEDPSGCKNILTLSGIQNLPNEILLQIFALLTVKDITQLSLVCRRWGELAWDPSLYRKLEFTKNQPSTRMAVKLIKMAPKLVSLSMKKRDDADAILRRVGTKSPRLKVLRLFECFGSPRCYDISPKNVFMYCTEIREIQMKNGQWQSKIWRSIVKYCKDIEMVSVHVIQDGDLAAIFDKFHHSLKILKIHNCADIDKSLLALASCSHMTTLLLERAWFISQESLSAIGDMPNLLDLEIRWGKLMTKEFWMILFQKPMMKRLTRLVLVDCRGVNDDVIRVIIKNSMVLKTLVTINDCDDTQLTVHEVKQLASHMSLDVLDIYTNGANISASDGVYL